MAKVQGVKEKLHMPLRCLLRSRQEKRNAGEDIRRDDDGPTGDSLLHRRSEQDQAGNQLAGRWRPPQPQHL